VDDVDPAGCHSADVAAAAAAAADDDDDDNVL